MAGLICHIRANSAHTLWDKNNGRVAQAFDPARFTAHGLRIAGDLMCAPLRCAQACGAREKTLLDPLPSAYPSARDARLGTHWAIFATRLTALILEKHSEPSTERFCQEVFKEDSLLKNKSSEMRCVSQRELPVAAW
jgi:hypothetical protein